MRGRDWYCSVCDRSSSRFLPVFGTCSIRGEEVILDTPNAVCPNCRSGIRQRLMGRFIREKTDLLVGKRRILHIAPEHGIGMMLAKGNDYVAMDIDPKRYPGAVRGDVTTLPPTEDYDAVICSHVLEHVQDDCGAIRSIFRVLRPGGYALIAVPTYGDVTFEDASLSKEERVLQYGHNEHVRLNGRDFSEKLSGAGFDVEIFELDNPPAETPHVDSDRLLFICRRPLEPISDCTV